MLAMTKFDFGVQIEPQYGFTYPMIREIARSAEALGFESIWVSDHLFMTLDSVGTNCLECWTTLTAIARDTESLRFGPMVSSQSYRNPALLAKIASSIDHISGGRLYFGIGAGWKEVEYRAYGYPFPRPAARIRQLEETIEIAKRMWAEEKATFRGRHYAVEEALCYPHPVQEPRIPIWVGGTGDLTLRVAARHADAVNFAWSQPPEFYEEKYETLKRHCGRVGRDFDEIRKSAGLMVVLDESPEGLERRAKALEERRDTPYMRYLSRQLPNIFETPEGLAERMGEYASLGVDHFILRFHFGDEMRSMSIFSDKVMQRI
jgi:F420-dependent oxidoreductase-like protein